MHVFMRQSVIFLLFLPLFFSCSETNEETDLSGERDCISTKASLVAFKSDYPSQRVYIFRKEGDVFRYNSMIDKGWTEDGILTTRLLVGEYKFLFTNPLTGQLNILPVSLDKTVTIEQLRFTAKKDDQHGENSILPVEELFLPSPEVADSIYTIRGGHEIKCMLKRRISQLEFVLNWGYKNGDEFIPQPFDKGQDILKIIKEIKIEILGVAQECNYLHTSGKGNVYLNYLATQCDSIDEQGFATFTGPFVFPPADNKEVDIIVTLISSSEASYPSLQLNGKLEANRKLKVNLWLNSSDFNIGVTIHNDSISERTDGDSGMWE